MRCVLFCCGWIMRYQWILPIVTSSNRDIFRVTGHLSGELTGDKGQWRRALMLSLICAWINGWVINGKAGDLRRHRAHYDVTIMRSVALNRCWCNFMIVPVPVRQSWGVWVDISYQYVKHSYHIDGLVQKSHRSSAIAMELRPSCINASI